MTHHTVACFLLGDMAKLSATDPQTLVWSCPGIGSSVPGGCPRLELPHVVWHGSSCSFSCQGRWWTPLSCLLDWSGRIQPSPDPGVPLTSLWGCSKRHKCNQNHEFLFLKKTQLLLLSVIIAINYYYYYYELLLCCMHTCGCVHCVSQQMWRSEDSFPFTFVRILKGQTRVVCNSVIASRSTHTTNRLLESHLVTH